MRISIILLAMALLVAYAIPSVAAECEKGQSCGQSCDKGGGECGKAEMACAEGGCGGECACKGECKEGCMCGCEGMCKGDCGKESCKMGEKGCMKAEGACKMGEKSCMKVEGACKMGGGCKMSQMRDKHTACACKPCKEGCVYGERCATCMVRESCEMRGECKKGAECPMMKGGCEMGGKCGEKGMRGECPMMKGEHDKEMCKECPMMKGEHSMCKEGGCQMGMKSECPMKGGMMPAHKGCGMMGGGGPGMMMHEAQYAVDRKLALMPCQRMRLGKAVDMNTEMSFKVMEQYFGDRCMSIEEVNRRMTMMNRKLDFRTRGMLNPMQDAVFPEHMYMRYGSSVWGDSFHPGAKYVFRKLRDKYMMDYDDWGRERPEAVSQVEVVIVEGEGE